MGLPIFGASNYTRPQFVPEPIGRGTWGLVQSCLFTLGLCVYSAIHVNVFHRECRWWTRALIRCKWLVVALLAPEFIVFNAWSQRRQALRIAHALRKRSGQVEHESWMVTLRRYLRPKSPVPDQERVRCVERWRATQSSQSSQSRDLEIEDSRSHSQQMQLD